MACSTSAVRMASSKLLSSSVRRSRRFVHTGKESLASTTLVNRMLSVPELKIVVDDDIKKSNVAAPDFLHNSVYTPADRDQERDFFRDFKYKITRTDLTKVSDPRFKNVLDTESQKPLVLVLGWAGANTKNLGKYADIYHSAGCDTLLYYLPTRFIFNQTENVPYLAVELLKGLYQEQVLDRPIFYHVMSDTGIMAYQGMRSVMRDDGLSIDTRGGVLDSCPGPIPEATFSRVMALLAINWICAVQDGKSLAESSNEVVQTARRVWPNWIRRMKGLPADISYVDGKWSGDFMKEDLSSPWPELFLYSKKDFYLPVEYMEKTLEERKAAGRQFDKKVFEKSGHVSHLMKYKKEYSEAVWGFLDKAYYREMRGE